MICIGAALMPIVRVGLGIDETFQIQFLTAVGLGMAGLMCGLSAMILMARRQPDLTSYANDETDYSKAAQLHATGLLIFTGIPLANFLGCFFLWQRWRHQSEFLDYQGREALCFQIAIYLYLLLALFMVLAIIGVFAIPIILVLHLLATVIAIARSGSGKAFRYPANITIIERTPHTRVQKQ